MIEKIGQGRGVKYILSRRFYKWLDSTGTHTRKAGLDRETNKALLLKHISSTGDKGAPLKDLQQVLPALSRDQIYRLLKELRKDESVQSLGSTRASRWYAQSAPFGGG
jgi:ATP-dependent DNA helicase RecG